MQQDNIIHTALSSPLPHMLATHLLIPSWLFH